MKNTILIPYLIGLLASTTAFAQNDTLAYREPTALYTQLIEKAYSLYKAKDYKQSALTYASAVKANGGIGYVPDRYNAACSWALAGNSDSAFFNLNRVASPGKYADYRHITTDRDLNSLHADTRWQPLLAIVQANKDKEEENYNKSLVRRLDSIYVDDQASRMRMDTIHDSAEMKNLIAIMTEKDSINLIKVRNILDQYGWLGADVIGQQGNTTLFLVIQHADLKTQEKYLPMMQKAVKDGKAEGSQLALLIDRVEMYNGRPQVYGSQITTKNEKYTIYKILDEVNVNKRRASVGLEPLEEYVKHWNITYKPLTK